MYSQARNGHIIYMTAILALHSKILILYKLQCYESSIALLSCKESKSVPFLNLVSFQPEVRKTPYVADEI